MIANVLAMRRYVRLTSFEQETAAGRAAERYRRASLSAIADALAKACGLMLMFVSVGLTIPYLGAERFGIWATITSLTAMLALLDLGMGNALINRVAVAAGSDDAAALVHTASGGLTALAGLGIVIGSLLSAIALVVPWGDVLKLHDPAAIVEARQAAAIFAVLFGCGITANGVRSIFIGLQRAYEAHLATALAYVAAIVAIWLGARSHADVPTLLVLSSGTQLLWAAILLVVAVRRGLLAWPGMSLVRFEATHLVRVGGLFLILQIGTMVGWGADSLLIAHVRGVGDVAQFNVVQRLFQLVSLPLMMMSSPLWSAYADAHARGERDFLHRTLRLSLLGNAGVGLIGVTILATIAQPVIGWWTKGAVSVPQGFVVAMAAWTLVAGVGAALGVFLNGTYVIRPQIVAVLAFVAIGLPMKWFWLSHRGLTAFVVASLAVYLVTHLTVYLTLFMRHVRARSSQLARSK